MEIRYSRETSQEVFKFYSGQKTVTSREHKETDPTACSYSVIATLVISPVISQPVCTSLGSFLIAGPPPLLSPGERTMVSEWAHFISYITAGTSDTASTSTSLRVLWLTQGDILHSVDRVSGSSTALLKLCCSLVILIWIWSYDLITCPSMCLPRVPRWLSALYSRDAGLESACGWNKKKERKQAVPVFWQRRGVEICLFDTIAGIWVQRMSFKLRTNMQFVFLQAFPSCLQF